MLSSVHSKLASLSDDFKASFQTNYDFVKIYTNLVDQVDKIWHSRRNFYEQQVTKTCEQMGVLLKPLPSVDIHNLSTFVKATKDQDKKLLKLCDDATNIIAGVEADVLAFGCKEHDVCSNKAVPCQCLMARM